MLDGLRSALTSRRVIELESVRLDGAFRIAVADEQSDLSVRRVFTPAFMVWLEDLAGRDLRFELEAGTLVVAIPERCFDAERLDWLLGAGYGDRHAGLRRPAARLLGGSPLIVVLIVIAIIVLIALFLVLAYNGMVRARNKVDEAWSGIDVQLKRRHDLIPNLVETVKGYATHEREVFEAVTQARAQAIQAQNAGAGAGRHGGGGC